MKQDTSENKDNVQHLERPLQAPRDLLLLSLALPQTWLWITLRSLDTISSTANLTFYAAEAITLFIFLLGLSVVSAKRPKTEKRVRENRFLIRAIDIFAAIVMSVVPATLAWAPSSSGSPIPFATAIAGGATLVWAYLSYFGTIASLDLARSIQVVLLAFITVPVLRIPLDLAPLTIAASIAAILPAIFAACLWRTRKLIKAGAWSQATSESTNHTASNSHLENSSGEIRLLPFAIELIVLGLILGLFRINANGLYENLLYVLVNMAIKIAFPLVMLLVLRNMWQHVSIGTLCQIALIFVALSLTIAANAPTVSSLSFVVLDYSRYVMVVLIFVALLAIASRTNQHPCAIFCIGMGIYVAALAVGLALRLATNLSMGISPIIVLDAVCILLVVAVVSESWEVGADLRLFSDGSPQEQPIQAAEQIDARCVAIASQYGLSPRELDTMQLICKGRSKRYIAEQLSLSENTVRGYAKTLYSKLDVHSRQELLTLLGIE